MPDDLTPAEREEVERTIAMAAKNMPLDVQAACSPTFMRAYLRVLSESTWRAGRDSLTARLREVEGERDRAEMMRRRLEHDLVEARHPGYQAWLASTEGAYLSARVAELEETLRLIEQVERIGSEAHKIAKLALKAQGPP